MEYMETKRVLAIVAYRLGQVRSQLGLVRPLSMEEKAEVEANLPISALALFQSMSFADQRHALRVYRGLKERGCTEQDMLAAALLHDVGKGGGRVPFWTRPAIVVGKRIAPQFLEGNVSTARGGKEEGGKEEGRNELSPYGRRRGWRMGMRWRRSLANAWFHAEVGADLAAAAGLSERAVLYIRTHHQADGPAALLHEVDEVS